MLHYFLSYTTTTAHRRLLSDCSWRLLFDGCASTPCTFDDHVASSAAAPPPPDVTGTSCASARVMTRCQGAGMYSGPGASFAVGFRAVVAWPKYFLLLEVRVASRSSGVGNLRIVRDC